MGRYIVQSARYLLFFPLIAVLAACASRPNVQVDYDPSIDFRAYQTFAFVDELGTDRGGYGTLVTDYFKTAVRREMEALGYRYDEDNPELKVNFYADVRSESEVRSSPGMMMMDPYYYGYRFGRYGAFPMYGYGGRFDRDVHTVRYRVGTANVDVVDVSRNRLVWEGLTEGRLPRNTLEVSQSTIDEAIRDIFQQYPLNNPASRAYRGE